MLRRIDVEADNVAHPSGGSATGYFAVGSPRGDGGELRIVGQLELPDLMGPQAMTSPDAVHRADADRAGGSYGGGCPMRGFTRRLGQCQGHRTLDHRRIQRRDTRGAGLVDQQPVRARLHEALLPAPNAGLGRAGDAHDLVGANAIGRKQHDLRAPNVLLWTVSISCDLDEAGAVGRAEAYRDTGKHPADSHGPAPEGIPFGTLPSGAIH